QVDAALEAVARLARQTESAPGPANPGGLKVRALQHDVRGARRDLRLGAAHDARHDGGPLRVADGRHLRRQGALDAVERDDLLPRLRPADHDRRTAQSREIERVQRLVQLEQNVVGRVHHIDDRPLADAREALSQPGGARPHLYAADHGSHVTRATFGVLETDLDAVHDATG